jgi:hypothetical protein
MRVKLSNKEEIYRNLRSKNKLSISIQRTKGFFIQMEVSVITIFGLRPEPLYFL